MGSFPVAGRLSDLELGSIRGTNTDDTLAPDPDDCSYFALGPGQVTWSDCYGEPDGEVDCVKCVNALYKFIDYGVPSDLGAIPYMSGFDCYYPTKRIGTCYSGTCQSQMDAGFCEGGYPEYGHYQ